MQLVSRRASLAHAAQEHLRLGEQNINRGGEEDGRDRDADCNDVASACNPV